MRSYVCEQHVKAKKVSAVLALGGRVVIDFEGDEFGDEREGYEGTPDGPPVPGDYLVYYANGFAAFWPGAEFERLFVPERVTDPKQAELAL